MDETTTPNPAPANQEPAPTAPTPPTPETTFSPSTTTPASKDGSGAVIWVLVSIIVLVILGAGGYYVWSSNQMTDLAPAVTSPTPPTVVSPTAAQKTASDEATTELNKILSSDETSAIKADLDKTNLEGLDKENADIAKQVQ